MIIMGMIGYSMEYYALGRKHVAHDDAKKAKAWALYEEKYGKGSKSH